MHQSYRLVQVTSGNMEFICKSCFASGKGFIIGPGGNKIHFIRYTTQSQTMSEKDKKAQLIYEESIKGYSFKFTSGFSRTVIEIIKKGIPANRRETTGPPEWKWYFGEEFFDLVSLALKGAGFTTTVVTKEEVENLRKKQEESSRFISRPTAVSIEDELKKFGDLLWKAAISPDLHLDKVKSWDREAAAKAFKKAALFYHPDRAGGSEEKMRDLNVVWNILKEGYYIK